MKRVLLILCLLSASCASFHEEHYFQTLDPSGTPVNFFRVRVDGHGGLTNLRYISGYYDERAVDLYFNEVKPPSSGVNADIQPLFVNNQINPGTTEVIKPLDPGAHGALLMIFSSNPNAIADTIGQFAESQQVADALTNLVSRGPVREMRALVRTQAVRSTRLAATVGELTALFSGLPKAADVVVGDKARLDQGYLEILRSIAITLDGDGKFQSLDEAAQWFQAKRSAQ